MALRYPTVLHALAAHAEAQPDKAAFTWLSDNGSTNRLTFGALQESALAVSRSVGRLAPEQMSHVLLACRPGLEFVTALVGILRSGNAVVPSPPAKPNRVSERLRGMLATATPSLIVSDGESESVWRDKYGYMGRVLSIDEMHLNKEPGPSPCMPDPASVALIQFTSGSTSEPRGVLLTHTAIAANAQMISSTVRDDCNACLLGWLPLFHDMGLIGHVMHPLYIGAHSVLMSSAHFMRRPLDWLRMASQWRATITGAPNFAFDLCLRHRASLSGEDLDLSSLHTLYCGSEPINADTLVHFARCFQSVGLDPAVILPCYGLAEATLMVSGVRPKRMLKSCQIDPDLLNSGVIASQSQGTRIVSCGKPVEGTAVAIIDPATNRPLGNDMLGEIWVQGPSLGVGYITAVGRSSEGFDGMLDGGDGSWLRTGDLGFLSDGELHIIGRLKDMMIFNGRNVYPHDVELVVQQALPDLPPSSVAAFAIGEAGAQRLVLIAEATRSILRAFRQRSKHPSELEALRDRTACVLARISEQCEVAAQDLVFVPTGALPKTSSGKLRRQALRQMYIDGKLGESYAVLQPQHALIESRNENGMLSIAEVSSAHKVAASETSVTKSRAENITSLCEWIQELGQGTNWTLSDERRCIEPRVILELGNRGVLGLEMPNGMGGLGLTVAEMMHVMSRLASVDVSLAALVGIHNGLGIRPIARHASEDVRRDILPELASGRVLSSFAITEPGAGSNPRAMEAVCRRERSGWSIKAHKHWIGLAQWAGYINVFARNASSEGEKSPDAFSGFCLPRSYPGVVQGPESLTLGVRSIIQNDVFVDALNVPDKYLLGDPGRGLDVAFETMQFVRLGIAAKASGAIERLLQLLGRYASQRRIGTGPLNTNGLYIDRVCEAVAKKTVIDALVSAASSQYDEGQNVSVALSSVCKIAGSEYAWETADTVMQLLGGRGYIETNVVSRYLRDLRLFRIFEGPTETLLAHLAAGLCTDVRRWVHEQQASLGESCLLDQIPAIVDAIQSAAWTGQQSHTAMHNVGSLACTALQHAAVHRAAACAAITSDSTMLASAWLERRFASELAVHEGTRWRSERATREALQYLDRVVSGDDGLMALAPMPHTDMDPKLQSRKEMNQMGSMLVERGSLSPVANDSRTPRMMLVEASAEAGSDRVASYLRRWCEEHFGERVEITTQTPLHRLGIDSIGMVDLTLALEREFGQAVQGNVSRSSTPEELAKLLEHGAPQARSNCSSELSVRILHTPEDLEQIFRLRYDIYVREMRRRQVHADHTWGRVTDPLDDAGVVWGAFYNGAAVGTLRVNSDWDGALAEYANLYFPQGWSVDGLLRTTVTTRCMVAPEWRDGQSLVTMAREALRHSVQQGFEVDYIDCNPERVPLFKTLGYRQVRCVEHPEYGRVHVMRLKLRNDTS